MFKKNNRLKKYTLISLSVFLLSLMLSNSNIMAEINGQFATSNPLLYDYTLLSNGEGPLIGLPSLSPEYPQSTDDTEVTATISDQDGIQNASLYWEYETLNPGVFENSSMIETSSEIINTEEFQRSGYITDTGVETSDKTDWRFGDFVYEAAEGELLNDIDCSIEAGGISDLVYVKIEAKNYTTGEWELRYLDGIFGSVSEVDPYPADYLSTELVAGYRIYAISYRESVSPPAPRFDYLLISQNVYGATIPAANLPCWVNYYMIAFDDLNQSTTTDTYSFLMDAEPEVTLNDLPVAIKGDQDYILNVSVTDSDGIETIDDSSVVAYYMLDGETEWSSILMDHALDFDDTAFYTGIMPTSNLENVETSLYIVVNASDIVDSLEGREGSSGIETILIDSLNPQVTAIAIDGGVDLVEYADVALITSDVIVTAEFSDPLGIESVNLYYSIPSGSDFVKIEMLNTTDTEIGVSPIEFNATIPATVDTALVSYFFETTDYLGNTGNTTEYYYYADGMAPTIDNLLIYPSIISNITDVTVLFNASDYTDLKQPVVWYSYDDGLIWDNAVANPIDYEAPELIDYEDTFSIDELPFFIQNDLTSYLNLEVIRGGGVSAATLSVDITHEKPTDIRIWLVTDDGERFLIFDREPQTSVFSLSVDLIALGLDEDDFTDAILTLEIQDYSELYSGSITGVELTLTHYKVPLGYGFMATIPASENDTTVLFYITLTDLLWNEIDTSDYFYYSDGLVPTINLEALDTPYNLNGDHYIPIAAEITDEGGISGADVYYRFSETDTWSFMPMVFDQELNMYVAYVQVDSITGTLEYMVRAFDLSGLSSETSSVSIDFDNGLGPVITLVDAPYSSPYSMDDERSFRITANVTDDGSVTLVQIHYKLDNDTEWTIVEMSLDTETGQYYYDIKVSGAEGILTFKIVATDDLDLVTESDIFTIEYENASVFQPLAVIIPVVSIAVIGTLGYLFGTKKIKLGKIFKRGA